MFRKEEESITPFETARQLGIRLDYFSLGDRVVGIYSYLGGYQIVINSEMDLDRQEDAVQLLIEHHHADRGIDKVLRKEDIDRAFEVPELSRFSRMVINSIIQRKSRYDRT
ncbi:hypothetical protein [Paenibacillus sp. NPDC058071]|uniref:hypothetical protein n=1 Tax=Paenibacillus sp. NPDC058071 TaxID=3346326 RepID=UPI0036D95048